VTCAAASRCQVIRLVPERQLVGAAGECHPMAVGVGALLVNRNIGRRSQPAGGGKSAEIYGSGLNAGSTGLRSVEVVEGD
jgi:hypothetical protein